MVAPTASDVFLSYSRADAQAVEAVRARLSEAGITSFLDRARLPAGQPWLPSLERELGRSGAVAVFLGQRMGSWQHREVQVALDRQGREGDFPVIPILLPGLDDEPTGFLSLQTWIDLRADLHDPAQFETLIAAIHREAKEDASAELKAGICPYRGLLPFREEDAGFFFGREQASQNLLSKVQGHKVVAVIGRSGSGKSSLVFAGLFSELRTSPGGIIWDMMTIRPESEPLHKLAEAISPPKSDLTRGARREALNEEAERFRRGSVSLGDLVNDYLGEQPGTDRLLLYVDQWEELYTQARRAGDESIRVQKQADATRFIDLLLEATEDRLLTLVFTVRADFYDQLLQHDRLTGIAQDQQISLGPLTEPQLRDCIEQPARKIGLDFEDGLVDRIVRDVGGDEGKLPLLEYALKGTWENSRKAWTRGATTTLLTHAAYETAGRVEGAIAGKADAVYGKLTDAQKDAARRLFVNLVTPGEGQADTRAIARVPDDPMIEQVVAAFSDRDQRLLVTGHDPVRGRIAEVSHEALIRNWGTLRSWIEANREILRMHQRIRAQMNYWEEKKEPEDLLLPRGALDEGRQLLTSHGDVLIDDIRPYIEHSIEHDLQLREEARRKDEEEHWTELARVQASLEAQEFTSKRMMRGVTAAGVVLLGALIVVALGWQLAEKRAAKIGADNEELASKVQDLAAAYDRNVRAWAAAIGGELLVLHGHEGMVIAAAVSMDGAHIVSGSNDRTVRMWNAANGAELLVLRGHEERVTAVGLSPDGGRIASGSADGIVRVWNAGNKAGLLVLRGHERAVLSLAFSANGARIGSGSYDRTVRVWDAENGEELLVLRGHERRVNVVAFSPDGARIVSGSGDGSVRVWDAASGTELLVLHEHSEPVLAVGFSQDGAKVVSGFADGTVRVWDAAKGKDLLDFRGHKGRVWAISPDGVWIVSGDDQTVRLWDVSSGAEFSLRDHQGAVRAAGFSPDGARIVSGSDDNTVRVWFVGKDDAAVVAHACARLPRELTREETRRFKLDPDALFRCHEHARALFSYPVRGLTEPAAGPAEGGGAAAVQ